MLHICPDPFWKYMSYLLILSEPKLVWRECSGVKSPIQFPAPVMGASQASLTPAPGSSNTSELNGYPHSRAYTHIQTHKHVCFKSNPF